MRKRNVTKMLVASILTASTLFLSVPNLATLQMAQNNEAVFLTTDGEEIPVQTMGSSVKIDEAIAEGKAATLFSNASVTLYGAPLQNTSEIEGEFTLTTGSPFTDLIYTHEDKFEGYEMFHGIDVSKWNNLSSPNEEIDWAACKEAGVDFAIVRVGYRKLETGELLEDPYYKQNIEGALANGISVGVYVFSEALTVKEAKEEAKFVLKCVKGYDVTFPLVMDYEGGYYTYKGKDYPGRVAKAYLDGTLTKDSATKIIRAFCKYIEKAGYTPMIYANSNYFLNYMNGAELGEDYPMWLARYAQSTNPRQGYLYYEGNYDIWQYSDVGYIGNMKVDCNFLYKNFNVKTIQPQVSDQTADTITLEWEPTDDALGYRIYRKDPDTGKYKKVGTTKKCSFTDEVLDASTEYTYKIRAYWNIGDKNFNAKYSKVFTASTAPSAVENLKVSSRTASSITLKWDAVEGAEGYVIYQYDAEEDDYIDIAMIADSEKTTYKVKGLDAVSEYQFVVCAYLTYKDEQLFGDDSNELISITKPAKTEKLKVSARTEDSLTIKWTKQDGVTGYMVYRFDMESEKWVKIATTSKSKYKDSGLTAGKEYQYRVRAYVEYNGKKYYGAYADSLSTITKPLAPTALKNTERNKKSLTITWKRDKSASGYIVYRYNTETEDYEELVTLKGNKKNTYTDAGLNKKTTYEYVVVSYKNYNDKVYTSAMSESISVTTKK